MSSSAKNKPEEKGQETSLRFPDRTACNTEAEYNADVKAYWKAIEGYRGLATAFHKQIMGSPKRAPCQSKKDSDSVGKMKIS